MKQTLLDKINTLLLRNGFTVRNLTRTCFDVLGRKSEQILLVKVLEDANSISRGYTEEMLRISSYIDASPLIISEKAGEGLDDNVVYTRFDIHTLNFKTFSNCINNKVPFIKRSKAGLTASVSSKKFKEKREEFGYSLNSLSKKIGVTSRMISKYESENSEVTINNAMKIYNIFGDKVFNKVDVFSKLQKTQVKFESSVSKKYFELGFDATDTKKTPFDVIARKDKEIILTEIGDKVNPQMESLSKLLDAENLVIFKKKKPKKIPSLSLREFMEFEQANELVRFLKEY
jgi:putative transcriptional regulator